MTLWLIRSGFRGEHEQKFLAEGRVYVAWDGIDVDLGALADRQGLIRVLEGAFPRREGQGPGELVLPGLAVRERDGQG